MTAEEIVQVIQAQTGKPAKLDLSNATNLRCACEVVVERDEEWQPALVLQVADGAYYIYFVGESMSENQWVDPTRIRFPANSPLNDSAWPATPSTTAFPARNRWKRRFETQSQRSIVGWVSAAQPTRFLTPPLQIKPLTRLKHNGHGLRRFPNPFGPGFGVLRNWRKRVEVDRDDLLGREQLHGPNRIVWPHRVIITNWDASKVNPFLADQPHIPKKRRIGGIINLCVILEGNDEPARITPIAPIRHAEP